MSWLTKVVGLDEWRDRAVKALLDAESDAVRNVDDAMARALSEIDHMEADAISKHLECISMGSAYIIQVPESSGRENADKLRAAVNSMGAKCVVVTANTMKVISFSAELDNEV